MHYVEHVTVAQIYKELRKMGVNISEATLDSWIAIGIDEFKPLMEPTQKEIVASGEAYMDETHLLVKCDIEEEARHRNELVSEGKATGKPVPLMDNGPVDDSDTSKNRKHYLVFPVEWTINPRKLACILRCADAAAIDSGRAPEYLFHILRLNGVSRDHWVAQNRLGVALDANDHSRLVVTSTHPFEEIDFSAWNVAYDAVKVVDEELNKCQCILLEQEQFQVKSVAGAKSRKALASYIKTKGWMPSDVSVHISDVAHLIMTLGGKELYGKEDLQLIVLRELIQNARDAIHARRLLEKDDTFVGKVIVKVSKTDDKVLLSVTDNGVGMSLETISHSLLNFGTSFWHEDSVNVEFPGLKTAGFKSVGQFGIGFFSAFMIAKSVILETRKYVEWLKDAHLVKFPNGLTLAPIFANHKSTSTSYSTVVTLTLDEAFKEWPTEYEAKRNKMNSTNFKVPFAAMLSTLVAGLDVDVYYKEFDKDMILVHHRIDAADLDKKGMVESVVVG